ncbi:YlcI/YnfO family protein [Nesterenkonia ebinurensis]|uniref:YlcI/YnfO family protein n=1 Tax=Nesterenkonia ebinurensis TaxID=2608252 RepID=UPI00123D8DBC|nr:YlcI/YnfO family protein [Nesterenkonia ebinurensis]
MQFDEYVTALQHGLAKATRLAPEEVQRTAELIGEALEPEARLALTRFASDLTEEITAELDGAMVEVHIRGGEPVVVVEQTEVPAEMAADPPPPPAPPTPPGPAEEGNTARLTLRLPDSLKAEIEKAAAAEGKSTNTWLVQAAHQALAGPQSPPVKRSGRRMTGWAH